MMRLIILFFLIILFGIQPSLAKSEKKPAAPTVYTFEDLKTAASNYRGDFYFDSAFQPASVKAGLGGRAANGRPAFYSRARARRIRAQGGYTYLNFPWNDSRVKEGDVVFIRGGDAVSWIIRYFSSWTHTAMVRDKGRSETFESLQGGVNVYNYKTAWQKIVSYSVKRPNTANPKAAVERAILFCKGTPYFPKAVEVINGLEYFFRKWSDKEDKDSMYCAKLVWWTFKDYSNIDLDSERTSSGKFGHARPIDDGYGRINPNAWIGVSPDDVYYSRSIGSDILIAGKEWLQEPLDDSIF